MANPATRPPSAPATAAAPATTDKPETTQAPRPRVSIDAEVWAKQIEPFLASQAFKDIMPIVQAIGQTGGVQPVKA